MQKTFLIERQFLSLNVQIQWRNVAGLYGSCGCTPPLGPPRHAQLSGGTTLYGPESLRTQIKFPAFCYFTAILIVGDATLGDTLRGFWHAIYATIQVVPLSMFSLWILGPGLLSTSVAALAVALSSFLVALPESTHLNVQTDRFRADCRGVYRCLL
ncbi:hypothetical protein Adt_34495 [Abeliophyllum distichum]|uniref:Uncharacterized protein n=1 Tax=Abeliophyllum distichum TaxID=126358 RepID=A0ABD1R088_9LAMI